MNQIFCLSTWPHIALGALEGYTLHTHMWCVCKGVCMGVCAGCVCRVYVQGCVCTVCVQECARRVFVQGVCARVCVQGVCAGCVCVGSVCRDVCAGCVCRVCVQRCVCGGACARRPVAWAGPDSRAPAGLPPCTNCLQLPGRRGLPLPSPKQRLQQPRSQPRARTTSPFVLPPHCPGWSWPPLAGGFPAPPPLAPRLCGRLCCTCFLLI